ncbi:hypothetical protein [Flammeovirga sp. SJP92]|uniref:hypothetical protein n=1 Tax=Flammeovirga sp. SJP92 TaxID=1775430 RepID=UPI0007889771|nr:hypothetical protein [Flammeovirga sp. SJP92]KXX66726.1 hypothetical protein AVL50_30710 [Flammeovirga sp. SJP92]
MKLDKNHINRLNDFLVKIRQDSQLLLNQFVITDKYSDFYSQYKELISFLNRIKLLNDKTFDKTVEAFPNLPGINSTLSIGLIKIGSIIFLLNPFISFFFILVFSPVTLPLLIIIIWKTIEIKSKLRKINILVEKIIQLVALRSEELTYKEKNII